MKKNIFIYGLLIFYLLFDAFMLSLLKLNYYNELFRPLVWLAIATFSILLSRDSGLRVKGEKDKTQSLFIVMIIYIIIYFLLGLVFGFERTPYAKDLISIFKNMWSFAGVAIMQEFARFALIKNEKKKKYNIILLTIIFVLLNLNITNFGSHFKDLKTTFIYCSSVFIPSILESAVLTYLVYIGGVKEGIIYRLFVTIPPFIVPIIPHLDWFGLALVGISLPLATYIYLNYVHVNRTERLTKKERRKYNPVIYIPVFVFIALLAGFVIGLFKYQPIAVLSGSMAPTFDRGDAAIIGKLSKEEKNKLEVGDVIQFVSGTKFVIHRIVKITNDEYGNKQFITKGDHNNANDVGKVNLDDVKGKVAFTIPFIGYPSVWLSGAVS